jgi:arabinoxylan arabinofuranohydrolase
MASYSGGVIKVPMTTASFGVRSKTDRATSYDEAPWIYKRGSLYYLVYAGGPISEHIAYATSPSATGPWTYQGVVTTAQGGDFTNHPGIVDFAGGTYFVYHNGALPGGGGYHRSVAIEKLTYNSDGTTPPLTMSTAGVSAVGTLNPFVTVEAETIAWETGVETAPCSEGSMAVTSINNGDTIKVRSVSFASGATGFEARVAASIAGGSIELYLDSLSGTKIGSCPVTATGGPATCAVTGAAGTHDVFLKFTGGAGDLFTFNWWMFTGPGADVARDGGALEASSPANGGTGGIAKIDGSVAGSGGAVASGGSGTVSGGTSGMGGIVASGGAIATGGDGAAGGRAGGNASGNGGSAVSARTTVTSSGGIGTGGASATRSTASGTSSSTGCSCNLAKGGHTGVGLIFGIALLLARRRR